MSDSGEINSPSTIRLGLRENLSQFSLLVLVNAYCDHEDRSGRTEIARPGLNEFAGYLAVGATAFVTGYIAAATHTLRPDPFYLGIGYAVFGLALSVLAIRDTSEHVRLDEIKHDGAYQ
jgi:hypothetical protein